jgi:hypothetical protein
MKKTILSIGLMIALGCGTAFANDDDRISKETAASFSRDFTNAIQVSWDKEKNYEVASFILGGQFLSAYYNDHSQLLVVIHHILPDRLPIYLMNQLKKEFGSYWVSGLYESANHAGSTYHITLENPEELVVMKSIGGTQWIVEKRIRKNLE